MWWPLYIALFMVWMMICRWKNRKKLSVSKQLKSDALCLPIIGHAHKFIGNDEVQMKAYEEFGEEAIKKGGHTSFWIGNVLHIMVADAVDAEFILKNYLEKGQTAKFFRAILDNGNIFAPVPIWRPRRKILVPTFCPRNIQIFANTFVEQSIIMADKLKCRVQKGSFSIWDYLTTYSMDSICEKERTYLQQVQTTMENLDITLQTHNRPFTKKIILKKTTLGVNLKTQENRNHPFIKAFEKGTNLVASRIISLWQHNDTIYKLFPSYYSLQELKRYLKFFFSETITSKRKELEMKRKIDKNDDNRAEIDSGKFKSFLELLIESSGGEEGYSDVELQEEIQVLVMAGTDTSAVGAAFTVLMLSRHPDVQQTAYEEVKKTVRDSNRHVAVEDLHKLKYLEAVIKETLRLYTPVPLTLRHIDNEVILPSGVTLVEDCAVLLNFRALHRNPQYWGPDCDQFKPERWFDKDNIKHPAQYMPFSCGPRNCVGYQYAMTSMKIVVATMLSHYRILPDTGSTKDGTFKPLRLKFDIMMKDVENFIINLENRD